jgi:hypothetical protein
MDRTTDISLTSILYVHFWTTGCMGQQRNNGSSAAVGSQICQSTE